MLGAQHSALAQSSSDPSSISWALSVGGESVTGALKSGASRYAVGLALQVGPPTEHFALRADLSYHGGLPASCSSGALCGGGLEVFATSIGVIFRLNDKSRSWSPYLLGGLAVYALDQTGDLKPAHFGAQYGAGFEVGSKKSAKLFLEVRYLDLSQGGLVPMVVGIRF